MTQYGLSENSTQVPTLHFIVEDTNTVLFTNTRLDTGINPAAAVYLLLMESGATTSQFNLTGFQLVANRYAALGYGLNITFSQRQKTRDCIESVLNYAGGVLVETQTESGSVFNLKVLSVDDGVAATLYRRKCRKLANKPHRRIYVVCNCLTKRGFIIGKIFNRGCRQWHLHPLGA